MKSTCILWTAAMDELLKKCIDAEYSATGTSREIVRQLGKGVSRQSCIGRAYRKGWRFHSDREITHARARPPKRRRARIVKLAVAVAEPVAIPVESLPAGPLNDFPVSGCKWIHGDPASGPWRCCAASVREGSSYCAHHERRSHSTPTAQQSRFVKRDFKLPNWAAA